MSRRTLLLLALLAAVVAAWWLKQRAPARPDAARPVARATERVPFQAKWATETEWLVDAITRNIRDLAALASHRPVPAPDAPAVKPESIEVQEHLLSPRTYESMAREALGAGASAIAASDGSTLDQKTIAALLEPRTDVLLSESAAVSQRLNADPRDAFAHERAALVLAAFGLRATEGVAGDARPALASITAHLSLARALRGGGEPGRAGRLAQAALEILVGREKAALTQLDRVAADGTNAQETSWVRALRLRITGDWRIARSERRLTLLETLEEFRALVLGANDELALEWLDARDPEPLSAWGRIALCSASASVGTSNRFADVELGMTLSEAMTVMRALRGSPADEASVFAALNESARGSVRHDANTPRIELLEWGLWASRFQRDLVSAIHNGWTNRYMLGQPGGRSAYAEQARSRFGRLATYALELRRQAEDGESYRRAMAAVRELAARSPERLTGWDWDATLHPTEFGPVPRDMPDPNQWFRPAVVQGTLLDFDLRPLQLVELEKATSAQVASLHEMAPHNLHVGMFAVGRLPVQNRSAAILAALYGPLAEFHLPTMGAIAQAAWYDPADFRARQGALCQIDARYCLLLGYRLAELGFADEAAVAYQKGFDGTRDRVKAANESLWLVDYYFDHGQLKKAEEVARAAAAVSSADALFTMARLMERMGRMRDAEEHYRRILDQYRNATYLAGFYYRRASVERKPEYEARLRDALALALPSGLEPLDRASLAGPPSDGVRIRTVNDNTKRCGIQFGNVIVGFDGFRVRNVEAYHVVRALSQAPKMKLVVWRGTSYDDVEAELWDRRFRVEIETYKPTS
jgi:hypothetical protein